MILIPPGGINLDDSKVRLPYTMPFKILCAVARLGDVLQDARGGKCNISTYDEMREWVGNTLRRTKNRA